MNKRRKSPVQVETTEVHMCSRELRLQILSKLPFFQGLSQTALEQINQSFTEKGFDSGDYIYFSGDPGQQLYVVAQGRVRLLRMTPGGKQVMLDLLVPGDFFGALPGQKTEYLDTAQAQTPLCLLTISGDDFRAVLEAYSGVALRMLDVVAGRLQAAHRTIQLLSAETAEKRIAHTLLTLAAKLGEPKPEGLLIQTPLSRDELAEMTGTTPETASRVTSQFQKAGWIATGRQWIALKDEDALRALIEDTK
jgi:CRP/FNR family transcriptional regulator, nitrogen oxide reductase regulator